MPARLLSVTKAAGNGWSVGTLPGHTKGNPPMTTKPIWQQLREHCEADPEHQRLTAAHRELVLERDAINSRLTAGTYKLQRLLAARDAVVHFANTTECTSSEQDEMLLECTATHGESWCGMFQTAADDITELALGLCSELAASRAERDQLEQRREAAYQLVRACAEQLEAEYREKHAGTTGPVA